MIINLRLFICQLQQFSSHWQFCNFFLNKSGIAYLGPMLPPSSRHWQLIYPNSVNQTLHQGGNVCHNQSVDKEATQYVLWNWTTSAVFTTLHFLCNLQMGQISQSVCPCQPSVNQHYKKSVVVQNKSNLLLKIFLQTFFTLQLLIKTK